MDECKRSDPEVAGGYTYTHFPERERNSSVWFECSEGGKEGRKFVRERISGQITCGGKTEVATVRWM